METNWTSAPPLNIGDEVMMDAPPPPTLLDRVLWRLFRIERKRPRIKQKFVITAMGTSNSIKAPGDAL